MYLGEEESVDGDFGRPVEVDGYVVENYVPSKNISKCVTLLTVTKTEKTETAGSKQNIEKSENCEESSEVNSYLASKKAVKGSGTLAGKNNEKKKRFAKNDEQY